MTSRERLLAAYGHEEVDRIPCSPRLHAWMLEYYGEGDCSARTLLRAAEEFGFDPHLNCIAFGGIVSLYAPCDFPPLPDVTFSHQEAQEDNYRVVRRRFETPEGVLTDETKFPPKGDRSYGISPNPHRTEYLVKNRSDLKSLRYLIQRGRRSDLDGFFAVEKELGERGLASLQVLSALCHRAGDAYPMTDMMMLYYDDRAFFDELLDLFQREMMEEVEIALEAGVRHFCANSYYNSLSTGWSPAIWREVFAPQLREMTDRVHAEGGMVNLYDDGKCMPVLEVMADAGIDVLQTLCPPPVGDADLAEAKRRIGDRVCLMGHVDLLYVIKRGTPELIERKVQEAIEAGGPRGFILGTSDSIRDGTPIENVRAYFDAARKYGQVA